MAPLGKFLLPIISPVSGVSKVDIDAYGRVTATHALTAGDLPTFDTSKISDFATAVASIVTNDIGITIQAEDADLNAIAVLSPADGTFIKRSGGIWTAGTLSSGDIPNNAANTSGSAASLSSVLLAAAFPALTGDVTTVAGALSTTLKPSVTIVTPTIASFTNAQHTHQNAAGGGSLDAAAIGSGTLNNARVNWASPSAIGGTAAAAGTFTTLTDTVALVGPVIAPASDATTAILITKADKSTAVATVDTTNGRVAIGSSAPGAALHVQGGDILLDNAKHLQWKNSVGTINSVLQIFSDNILYFDGQGEMIFRVDGSHITVDLKGTSNVFSGIDSATTAITNVMTIAHILTTANAGANGIGTGLLFQAADSTSGAGTGVSQGRVRTQWTTATDASRVANMILSVFDTSEHDIITLTAAGKVGIGGSPSHFLDVVSDVGVGGSGVFAAFGDINNSHALIYLQATAGISGVNSRNNNDLAFYTNNVENVRIATSGNVGLGTTSPGQLLDLYDGNLRFTQLASAGALTSALAGLGAGNLSAGLYKYKVTFVTAVGETQAGTANAGTTVVTPASNGQIALSAIPTGGAGTTSRKVYRTQAGGSTYNLLTTIADNTTTVFTDNVADATIVGNAAAPSLNTTGGAIYIGTTQAFSFDQSGNATFPQNVTASTVNTINGSSSAAGVSVGATNRGFFSLSSSSFSVSAGGPVVARFDGGLPGFVLGSSRQVAWTSTADPSTNSPDTGFVRDAAAVIRITNGSTGIGAIGVVDTATAAVTNVLTLTHALTTANAGANNIGTGLLFQAADSTSAIGTGVSQGRIRTLWTTATDASRVANMVLSVFDTTEHDVVTLNPNCLIIGGAQGNITSPTTANTNLQFYQISSSNWAGVGIDGSGNLYIRTGLSGSAAANFAISPNGNVTIGSASTAFVTANLELRGPTGVAAVATTPIIQLTRANGGIITQETVTIEVGRYLNDAGINPYTQLAFKLNDTSLTTQTVLTLQGNGVMLPFQAPTASAPTYVKGGIYFDTTLNKLRIGGASGWETVTSS